MNNEHQAEKLQAYYKWHAPFYDATRWSFLFGRSRLIKALPDLPLQPRVLEVGCGTGRNLHLLARLLPDAQITGIDLSSNMLRQANRKTSGNPRINLLKGRYGFDDFAFEPFDLIFLSYSITMIGEEMGPLLRQTNDDLRDGGHIAVVDFHRTPHWWFQQWMNANHVKMDSLLLPLLKKSYQPICTSIYPAYLGLWSYFLFLGKKA